jgi:thioredoxin reductase (NADPH)
MQDKVYDVIIIGGGPSGLTAGLYCSRAMLKTMLLERAGCGGQTASADFIENYPAIEEGIAGFELAMKIEAQAKKFGLEVVYEEARIVTDEGSIKTVLTADKSYKCKTVIISSGADHRHLGVPSETEFIGKGVSYCATCDGPFYKDKRVMVVGGGDSAVQEALFLTRFASKVIVAHRRDKLRATAILQQRALANPKIELLFETTVTSIDGVDKVQSVALKNVKTNAISSLPVDGVFIYVGLSPNTDFVRDVISLDPSGYVITDDHMKTSVNGIYACGDVRKKLLRQVVTATGDGATAAFAAQEYIAQLDQPL